jgi:hypothetical protein
VPCQSGRSKEPRLTLTVNEHATILDGVAGIRVDLAHFAGAAGEIVRLALQVIVRDDDNAITEGERLREGRRDLPRIRVVLGLAGSVFSVW